MITLKVWQLMVIGLGLVVAAFGLLTMSHKGSNGPAAPIVTPVEQAQAQAIVNATPTVQAYFAKHKSYAKLKLPATTGVTVASATPSTFCLESAGPLPHIFKNGPTGPLMIGTCANTAGGTPYTN